MPNRNSLVKGKLALVIPKSTVLLSTSLGENILVVTVSLAMARYSFIRYFGVSF